MTSSSATGILTVYQNSIGRSTLSSSGGPSLTPTTILDAFLMHSLLIESAREEKPLQLPHHGEQSSRLVGAMNERNLKSAGVGLHHWAHRCDLCHVPVVDSDTGIESEFNI